MKSFIKKIISGGQTGVDRAALDAALRLEIQCGGWCPAGRWAEDGEIADIYSLNETDSTDPAERTGLNVADSDGTLLLTDGPLDVGSKLCLELTHKLDKPHLVFDFSGSGHVADVRDWIRENNIAILNVAGPRESNAPGIYELTIGFLTEVLGSLK